MIKIFDTLQKNIVPLDITNKSVNFYSCGPTVYGYAHIGNLRSFIMADILFRTLKSNGNQVKWVMNITDIDDKTIRGCLAEFGNEASIQTLKTYTTKFTEKFIADLRAVGVNTEQIDFIDVSDVIPQIQEFVLKLKQKGYAYTADDGSTYFSIEKYQQDFGDYGNLVGSKFLEGKKVNARIKNDEYEKEDLSDFALWKAWDESDGQIFWDHPELGKGRPGWHIECSAINNFAFKGEVVDIHTGGIDLVFPHHTNEIAQSQPLGPFVKHWVHFEHLLVDSKKMAKSAKNDYTLNDIEGKGFSGLDLRYLLMQSNFRQQTNFTWESLEAAATARMKLQKAVQNTEPQSLEEEPNTHTTEEFQKFLNIINNNLNTAEALAYTHQNKNYFSSFDQILGLQSFLDPLTQEHEEISIPSEVQKLLEERATARETKDFTKSDELRQQILDLGFTVKDTAEGQIISK